MLMTTQALTEYAVLAASRTGAALGQAVGVVRGFVSEHFLLVTAALILVVFYLTVNVGRGR